MKKLVLAMVLVVGAAVSAAGQGCSVCTKTAAGLDKTSARGLNGGILYLAFLPLAIIGTVGAVWWKRNK
ncbi:MAG: hypothetical protein V4649_15890 [Bacteroidota bacterium]